MLWSCITFVLFSSAEAQQLRGLASSDALWDSGATIASLWGDSQTFDGGIWDTVDESKPPDISQHQPPTKKPKPDVNGAATFSSSSSTTTCEDKPFPAGGSWYDIDGPFYNCGWYASSASYCQWFGHSFANEGLTANTVCCACGGGTPKPSSAFSTFRLDVTAAHGSRRWCIGDFKPAISPGHAKVISVTTNDKMTLSTGRRAFDNDEKTSFCARSPNYLEFKYDQSVTLTSYSLAPVPGHKYTMPKEWHLRGSRDDGVTWNVIHAKAAHTWSPKATGRRMANADDIWFPFAAPAPSPLWPRQDTFALNFRFSLRAHDRQSCHEAIVKARAVNADVSGSSDPTNAPFLNEFIGFNAPSGTSVNHHNPCMIEAQNFDLWKSFALTEDVYHDEILFGESSSLFYQHKALSDRLGDRRLGASTRASGPTLYVVDSGIDFTHPEFKDGKRKPDFFVGNKLRGKYNTNDWQDDLSGHGTACAAIAVGKTFGVTGKATAQSVRVLDEHGLGSASDVMAALDEIKKTETGKAVVLLSFSSLYGTDSLLDTAVTNLAQNQKIEVVMSAGNDGRAGLSLRKDSCNHSPASTGKKHLRNVFVVSSLVLDTFKDSDFSSKDGGCVTTRVVGEDLVSATRGGGCVKGLRGTSFAAALQAGLLLSREAYPLNRQKNVDSSQCQDVTEGHSHWMSSVFTQGALSKIEINTLSVFGADKFSEEGGSSNGFLKHCTKAGIKQIKDLGPALYCGRKATYFTKTVNCPNKDKEQALAWLKDDVAADLALVVRECQDTSNVHFEQMDYKKPRSGAFMGTCEQWTGKNGGDLPGTWSTITDGLECAAAQSALGLLGGFPTAVDAPEWRPYGCMVKTMSSTGHVFLNLHQLAIDQGSRFDANAICVSSGLGGLDLKNWECPSITGTSTDDEFVKFAKSKQASTCLRKLSKCEGKWSGIFSSKNLLEMSHWTGDYNNTQAKKLSTFVAIIERHTPGATQVLKQICQPDHPGMFCNTRSRLLRGVSPAVVKNAWDAVFETSSDLWATAVTAPSSDLWGSVSDIWETSSSTAAEAANQEPGVWNAPVAGKALSCTHAVQDALDDNPFVCFHKDSVVMAPCDGCVASSDLLDGAVVRPMKDLRTGDRVLVLDKDSGQVRVDRVSINLHVSDERQTYYGVTLHYAMGQLSVTDKHMVDINGQPRPAHSARPGDILRVIDLDSDNGSSKVVSVPIMLISRWEGGIINPLTHGGYILAGTNSIKTSPGVGFALAATVVDSPHNVLLTVATLPSTLKLSSLIFPEQLQASGFVEGAIMIVCTVSSGFKTTAQGYLSPGMSVLFQAVAWLVCSSLFVVVDVCAGFSFLLYHLIASNTAFSLAAICYALRCEGVATRRSWRW